MYTFAKLLEQSGVDFDIGAVGVSQKFHKALKGDESHAEYVARHLYWGGSVDLSGYVGKKFNGLYKYENKGAHALPRELYEEERIPSQEARKAMKELADALLPIVLQSPHENDHGRELEDESGDVSRSKTTV